MSHGGGGRDSFCSFSAQSRGQIKLFRPSAPSSNTHQRGRVWLAPITRIKKAVKSGLDTVGNWFYFVKNTSKLFTFVRKASTPRAWRLALDGPDAHLDSRTATAARFLALENAQTLIKQNVKIQNWRIEDPWLEKRGNANKRERRNPKLTDRGSVARKTRKR